jgi:dolichol-phosphate mannosyltransferase
LEGINLSVIVPALNEAANLPTLAERIHAALGGRTYELLIVDDNSRDNTQAVCAELATKYPLRLIVRTEPKDGLSGAVLHGMAEAKGEYLAVMDADLQHPPEKLPDLVAPLERGEADFVIGSRYIEGGTIETGWTFFRRINSGVATLLARPFAGRVSDPMSGFFALRRSDYASATRLTPLGYKIALELLTKCRVQRVKEIPIHFGKRLAGESKLSLKEQFRYLEHLSRLYDFSFPRLSPILKFLIVMAFSWFAGWIYYLNLLSIHATPTRAAAAAYLWVIAVTAVFHARYVRTQREFLVHHHPWRDFWLAAAAEWLTCIAAAWYLSRHLDPGKTSETHLLLLSFAAAMIARYVLRKELLLDVRGLRYEVRKEELLP